MTHKISHRNVARDDRRFVISTCGFTFQGYALLLKKYGIDASHIHFEGDDVCQRDGKISLIINMLTLLCFRVKGLSLCWKV
jgi:hypothetical protein